ncbi:cell division protein FtsQ/DivIB, partial [Anaerotruncus massiliensis (ex Liu et al. 2021)]|uniref:cell division protein FtsQ/DivIB n=2 Tax=Oscillospiraceae TaxID=216572 RepID=UPI003AB15657
MKQKLLSFGGRTPRAPDRAQAAAAAGARRRRKRTGRQTLYYLLILLVAAAVVAVLSLTVFFRIEKLEVAGVTKYAAEEIIEASGVKVGDNLFRVNARRVEKKLTQQFPYVEGVALRRTLPATLTLEIAQAKPLGAVSTAAGYVVIGKTGRVLEIGAASVPQDVMTVTGMYLYDPKVGQKLGEGYTKEETDEADKEAYGFLLLSRLMDAVEETDFGKVSLVDFSNQLDMMLVYDNRLLIDLGGGTELPYKLRFAKKVIEDELSDTFEGRLDVSLAPTTNEIYS